MKELVVTVSVRVRAQPAPIRPPVARGALVAARPNRASLCLALYRHKLHSKKELKSTVEREFAVIKSQLARQQTQLNVNALTGATDAASVTRARFL